MCVVNVKRRSIVPKTSFRRIVDGRHLMMKFRARFDERRMRMVIGLRFYAQIVVATWVTSLKVNDSLTRTRVTV